MQPPPRRLSCLQRGRLLLVAALFKAEVLPVGRLVPEPWPEIPERLAVTVPHQKALAYAYM